MRTEECSGLETRIVSGKQDETISWSGRAKSSWRGRWGEKARSSVRILSSRVNYSCETRTFDAPQHYTEEVQI